MVRCYCGRTVAASAALLLAASLADRARAQTAETKSPTSTVTVEVLDSESGDPISQARLTLQFDEATPRRKTLGVPKRLSYSAKTNAQGRYRFTNIYKGKIHLIVTADRHQSFGKDYDLAEDNQLIQVKLKKPQPLL
jgi:hypothetical protein